MKVLSGLDASHASKVNDVPSEGYGKGLGERIFVALAQALMPIAPGEPAVVSASGDLSVVSASADLLRSRVLANARVRPKHLLQAEEGEFVRVLAGVYVKQLRADAYTETGLWRLEPGAVIPAHGHRQDEECLVVSGSICYAGRTLFIGDFLAAAKDEYQGEITSINGALLLIRGELRGNRAAVS